MKTFEGAVKSNIETATAAGNPSVIAELRANGYNRIADAVQSYFNARLEYLRGELRAECISWGELAELQSLAEFIEPGDVELLEPDGVPEVRA